jgi:chromosome segregation protein
MHVIVGQGQLDTVLRATPIERRALIEEAAGILKYRRRKEKTERKLEAMQVNLVRLQDLTSELRRNLTPLGRQAEVARQAQEIAAIARESKSKLLAHQIRNLQQQLELASKSESERKAESSYAQQQLTASRMGIQELEGQLVSTELDELRKRMFALESQESKLRSLKNLAEQRISLISQQELSSREAEVTELDTQLKASEAELALVEGEIANYFSGIYKRPDYRRQEFRSVDFNVEDDDNMRIDTNNSMSVSPFTKVEVCEASKSSNFNKGMGPDCFDGNILS